MNVMEQRIQQMANERNVCQQLARSAHARMFTRANALDLPGTVAAIEEWDKWEAEMRRKEREMVRLEIQLLRPARRARR